MSRDHNRRRLLGGIGLVVMSAFAGCSQGTDDTPTEESTDGSTGGSTDDSAEESETGSDDDTENSSENDADNQFTYPTGFSQTGIDTFTKALGTESEYYNRTYVQITTKLRRTNPRSENVALDLTTRFDGLQDHYLIRENRSDLSRTLFYTNTTSFQRTIEDDADPEYRSLSGVSNKQNAFLLPLFRDTVVNVEFNSEITDNETIKYTATEAAYPDDHSITDRYSFPELTVVLEVDQRGLVQSFSVEGSGEEDDPQQTLEYSFKYDEQPVQKPAWFTEQENS